MVTVLYSSSIHWTHILHRTGLSPNYRTRSMPDGEIVNGLSYFFVPSMSHKVHAEIEIQNKIGSTKIGLA